MEVTYVKEFTLETLQHDEKRCLKYAGQKKKNR